MKLKIVLDSLISLDINSKEIPFLQIEDIPEVRFLQKN